MASNVLITGATGHLGPHLIAELLRLEAFDRIYVAARPSEHAAAARVAAVERLARTTLASGASARSCTRVIPLAADVHAERLALAPAEWREIAERIDVVIHAAADTRFAAPVETLERANVHATRTVCGVAAQCRRLRQLLFVSTACVAGRRVGRVAEQIADDSPGFVNGYEQTKWQAEQIVAASGLPARIARLTTCLGSHRTGYVHRFGAVHHLVHWVSRGLVPMVPGSADSRIDLISTDVAAAWLARAAVQDPSGVAVCHVALGDEAIPLDSLLDVVTSRLAVDGRGAQVKRPLVVDRGTFEAFQEMVRSSGDALFARVQGSAGAMLPSLLYPKTYETETAERCWGGALPHPDWRTLLSEVIGFGHERRWGLSRSEACA
jgi:thioester reductase-like protein